MSLQPTATRYEFRPAVLFTGKADDNHELYRHDAIEVEWRGGDTWVVKNGVYVWNEKKGEWEYEPSPSNRSERFLARTRYPLKRALAIAERLANEELP